MKKSEKKHGEIKFKQAHAIHQVGELEDYLRNIFPPGPSGSGELKWRLFVLLFVRPANQLGIKEIIPNLDYLHYHTGDHLDFFCVGYHRLDKGAEKELDREVVKVGDGNWRYSNLHFNKLNQFFEIETRWKYSGRSDMIIANYTFQKDRLFIDYGGAIALNLENALECGAINSVEEFITDISNFAGKHNGKDPAFDFFKKQVLKIGKKTIWQYILNLLPKWLSKAPQQLDTFLLVDIRKKAE